MKQYLYHLFIAVDQFATAVFGGYPDETVSSYLYRLDNQNKLAGRLFRPAVDWLFFWQVDHCRMASLKERARLHMPPALR